MSINEAIRQLKAIGWREYSTPKEYVTLLCKCLATPTPCAANGDKPGQQVCIYLYNRAQMRGDRRQGFSYEIEISGQLTDGSWIRLRQHSFDGDIMDSYPVIRRLLSTWEHIAACAPPEDDAENKSRNV